MKTKDENFLYWFVAALVCAAATGVFAFPGEWLWIPFGVATLFCLCVFLIKIERLLIALLLACAMMQVHATNRYVSTTGANTGAGGIGAPWLTLDYASANSSAGDTININNGIYTERWTIGSSEGGSAGNPKRYIAINPLMVTNIGGFTVSQGAGYIEFSGIKFQDGASNPDWEGICWMYHSTSGAALGANMGWTNCWFQGVMNATNHNIIGMGMENATSYAKYADHFSLVQCVFTNNSQYSFRGTIANATIISNRFDFANTHDAMQVWGTNVNICYNTLTNITANPNVNDHTDLFQFWWDGANPSSSSPSTNIFIHHNLAVNCEAQFFQVEGDINSSSSPGPVGGIYVYNNIFNNVQHHGSIDLPDFHVWNNLFYNCIMSDGSGDLLFFAGAGNAKGESKNSSCKNNAFIGCGASANSTTTGWYDASELGVPSGFVADYNFVCNADFTAKNNTDFRANGFEVHGINGGDPKFEYAAGNLFHLRTGSPLIDVGVTISGVTNDFDGNARPLGSAYEIGPYEFDPSLLIKFNPAVPFTSLMDNLSGGPQDGIQMQSTNWPYSTNFQGRAGAQFTVRTGNVEGGTEVGYGDYIAITNLASLQTLTNGTISFWAFYGTITNWDNQLRVERIIDGGYQGSTWSAGTFFIGRGFSPVTGDNYQTVMREYGTDGLANPTTMLSWPDVVVTGNGTTTNFIHYVMTWSPGANNLRGYLNGSLVTSNTMGQAFYKMTNDFNWVGIGCWTHDGTPSITDSEGGFFYPNNGWFHGTLGETRIYNRALSDAEVLALYSDQGAAASSGGGGGGSSSGNSTALGYRSRKAKRW